MRNDYQPMLATLAEDAADRRRLAVRDEVGRLPRARLRARRRGEARLAKRQRPDRAVSRGRQSAREGGAVAGLRRRRRGVRARREGRPSFSAMQQGKPGTPLVYAVFDVLEVDGEPVVDLPLAERRERLEALLDRAQRTVQISGAFDDGEALYDAAKEQGLEGVMAKRESSRYLEGRRTRDWLKIKTHRPAGVRDLRLHERGRAGARAASARSCSGCTAAGSSCGSATSAPGSTSAEIDELLAKLEPLEQARSPLEVVPKMPKVRKGDVVWVEPELVCEVEFAEWTHDGHLRAPRFQGLREDKSPRRGAPRASGRRSHAEALESRQGLLAGRGDHEGRPDRVLPRRRAGARPASPRPAVHDAPVSGRRVREGVLPEGRAVAHAGLDPAFPRAGVDARGPRGRSGSTRRS